MASKSRLCGSGPLFSVCIPNYNYGCYLRSTIESVVAQSFQDFEIIVADNASTDDSVEVVEKFSDARIKLIKNETNVGFAHNLDRATERAIGQYLILLSSDDLIMPDALERYAGIIREYRAGPSSVSEGDEMLVLFSAIEIIDSDGKVFDRRFAQPWLESNNSSAQLLNQFVFTTSGYEVLRRRMVALQHVGHFASTCVSRRIFEAVCGYRSFHTIDPDTFYNYKCLLLNPTVKYIEEPLFRYRVHNQNQTAQERKQVAPKLFFDKYYYTIEFADDDLHRAGISRQQLIDSFLDHWCGHAAIMNALKGNGWRARQAFLTAAATYPGQYFQRWRSYLLLLILLTGPITPMLASVWRRVGLPYETRPIKKNVSAS
jgi:glycosyltransferase involved in cell wall biosynthesis